MGYNTDWADLATHHQETKRRFQGFRGLRAAVAGPAPKAPEPKKKYVTLEGKVNGVDAETFEIHKIKVLEGVLFRVIRVNGRAQWIVYPKALTTAITAALKSESVDVTFEVSASIQLTVKVKELNEQLRKLLSMKP